MKMYDAEICRFCGKGFLLTDKTVLNHLYVTEFGNKTMFRVSLEFLLPSSIYIYINCWLVKGFSA